MNQKENIIWTAGDMDNFIDTFRSPIPSKVFEVIDGKILDWPSFHPSQADPDGHYQIHTYSVKFSTKKSDLKLYIKYIASTPRIPYLQIKINNKDGYYYPYPIPSDDKQIKPSHALHASIYNKDEIIIYIPAKYVNDNENIIEITAIDEHNVVKITNQQAVLRLDRMADACGFHYGAIELEAIDKLPKLYDVKMYSSVVYIKDKDGLLNEECQMIITNTFLIEKEVKGVIKLSWENGCKEIKYNLPQSNFGQIKFDFLLPDGAGEVFYQITGDIEAKGSFKRKIKWKVYTTPHAHTDIGYTHRQWEVAERMSRNLDTAVKLLDKDKEHLSYILDSAWSLDEFLKSRSKECNEKVIKYIKDGYIGVPWNYVDLLTQFPSLEATIHNGDFSSNLLGEYIPDRVDVIDVASISSSYPTILKGSGVKYIIHADNQDRGPFRLNGGLHKHNPFWWEGPDGSKIIMWLAKMYCELKKVCGSPFSIEAGKRGLNMWLLDYERETYIPDAVILYGMEADNTDIDVRVMDFYKEWEKEIAYPKLISSNGSTFFEYIMQFSDYFETYKGDEGAYWEDGIASSVIESFAVREAESGIRLAEILDSFAVLYGDNLKFPLQNYNEAWKQVLLYNEHTWGAFLSGSDPNSLLQTDQWNTKKSMADQAKEWKNHLLSQSASKLSLIWNNKGREIVVYNPYSFTVADYVKVEIGLNEEVDGDYAVEKLLTTQKIITLYTGDIQAFSYKRFPLKECNQSNINFRNKLKKDNVIIENNYYKVEINTNTAYVKSFYDKELNKELAQGNTLGQLLYAHGGEGSTLIGNKNGLNKDGAIIEPCFKPNDYEEINSKCSSKVIIRGEAFFGKVEVCYELLNHKKELQISYIYDKEDVYKLEAVYVDFNFNMNENSKVLSDSQIGWVDWENNCLPGACREWLPLQTSILVKDSTCNIQIASKDAFLFTVNEPVKGKWDSNIKVSGNRIYSYVLNNYWRCNYKPNQGGHICFKYSLTSNKEITFEEAYRFGTISRHGLIAQRMSYQEFREDVKEVFKDGTGGIFLTWNSDHISLSTIRGSKDGEGFILRLIEIGGKEGNVIIGFKDKIITKAILTDHQERENELINIINKNELTIDMKAWQVKTIKIK